MISDEGRGDLKRHHIDHFECSGVVSFEKGRDFILENPVQCLKSVYYTQGYQSHREFQSLRHAKFDK